MPDPRFCEPKCTALVQRWSFGAGLVSWNKIPIAALFYYQRNFVSRPSLDVDCFKLLVITKNLDRLVQIGQQLTQKYCRIRLLLC